MGTAGHIDHGKTALIEAPTGINYDTHPEEKRRAASAKGIAADLNFSATEIVQAASSSAERLVIYRSNDDALLIKSEDQEGIKGTILEMLTQFHRG